MHAIEQHIATPMDISVIDAAYGIHSVVNESMVAATRIHVAERGADVRTVFLMAFGGAGPVHADAIARSLKMPGYVIPPAAGVNSALGFLAAPTSFELSRSISGPLNQSRLAHLDELYTELEEDGRALLEQAGVPDAEMEFTRRADLRHAGQGHEIVLDLPFGRLADVEFDRDVARRFYAAHTAVYGHAHEHLSLEIVAVRVTASGPDPELSFRRSPRVDANTAPTPSGNRGAYFPNTRGFVATNVHQRSQLKAGMTIAGPAIIEEPDSTTIVAPDARLLVGDLGHLVVTFE